MIFLINIFYNFRSVQSANLKSHSTHNLTQNTTPQQDQGFYQNLSVYRGNSSQPNLDR